MKKYKKFGKKITVNKNATFLHLDYEYNLQEEEEEEKENLIPIYWIIFAILMFCLSICELLQI